MPTKPPRLSEPGRAPSAPRNPGETYGWAKGSDRRWRKLRKQKLDADPLCERCKPKGRVVEATEVHHIVPISQGGEKYDYGNLESRCAACHQEGHGAKPRVQVDPLTGLRRSGSEL